METIPDGCKGIELVQVAVMGAGAGLPESVMALQGEGPLVGKVWEMRGRIRESLLLERPGKGQPRNPPHEIQWQEARFEGAHTPSGGHGHQEHCREGMGRQVTRSMSLEALMACEPWDVVVIPGGSPGAVLCVLNGWLFMQQVFSKAHGHLKGALKWKMSPAKIIFHA